LTHAGALQLRKLSFDPQDLREIDPVPDRGLLERFPFHGGQRYSLEVTKLESRSRTMQSFTAVGMSVPRIGVDIIGAFSP
jgi:hypothetical protein